MIQAYLHGIHINPWDIALIVAVASQATLLAYLYAPKWKAVMISLPIPFTISTLAIGHQINATTILGFALLLMFTHGVRILHLHLRLQIVLSIIACAVMYCGLGWLLAAVVPKSEAMFWWSCVGVILLALLLLKLTPYRNEPGHREPLPVYIKLPLTALITILLVLMKQGLQGFMSLFPMVGVFAAYEARHSLWTMARQIPILVFTLVPLILTSRFTQPLVGLGWSLVLGWLVYLAIFIPMTLLMWKAEAQHDNKEVEETQPVNIQVGS
ncbi:MAG: hypothetical protein ACYDBB_04360 [Armatimonadota bacterium]